MKAFINSSIIVSCLLIPSIDANAEVDNDQALASVESSDCGGHPISEALKHTLKKHSQRDLGWRVFSEQDYVDVERAILVNKGKQNRYRWRIDNAGYITPVSKKAKKLCD